MSPVKENLLEKLDKLSELDLHKILNFVESISQKSTSESTPQDDPILSIIGTLSGDGLLAEEIEETLYGKEHTGK